MGLKSDCFSFVLSKSADSWGWDSSEERLGDGHTSGLPHRSISIVDDGRLEVCDGAHWAFVMKKSQRPRPSLRDRTGHPRTKGKNRRTTGEQNNVCRTTMYVQAAQAQHRKGVR